MPAPTEDEALAALRVVQDLGAEDFQAALKDELGGPVLQVMNALARALNPDDDEDAIARKMHLMMLAWLMARRAQSPRS
jgi:hypothetical protein